MIGSIQKFFQNKNTVTVVGVVLAIVILYVAYNMRVKSAINPITVPYAVEQISPGTQITSDKVGTREVPPSMLAGDVIRSQSEVIDKYSSADTIIPEGSLFYERAVVEKEQLPANIILDYPNGYEIFDLKVSTDTTYGNSIYPGNYVDVWLKAINKVEDDKNVDKDKIIYSKLISNVKILAVKDSAGKPVFSNLDEEKTPAMIIFAVPTDMFILLRKAQYMRAFDTSIDLVPTHEGLKDNPDDIGKPSDMLINFINEHTIWDENME